MPIRTFICFEIPRDIKAKLHALQQQLKNLSDGVSWTRPEGIHLTLKFLGDVAPDRVPQIYAALNNAKNGIAPFEIEIADTGAFPNFARPRIYWLGVNEPTGQMLRLQQQIEAELSKIGFEPEDRRFSPHLTLGRVKDPRSVEKTSQFLQHHAFERCCCIAHEMIIMKSDLQPSGAVYTPLETIHL